MIQKLMDCMMLCMYDGLRLLKIVIKLALVESAYSTDLGVLMCQVSTCMLMDYDSENHYFVNHLCAYLRYNNIPKFCPG